MVMQTATYTATYAAPVSMARVRVGRFISGFAILFLLFDGVAKALRVASVVDASAKLGFSAAQTFGIGVLLLACVAAFALPRTAPLGALLLTGYLGGAVVTNVRAGSPLFSVIFPVLIGALVWAGLALRDRRVRALLSLQP
jgi:hypothetical protein